MAKRRTKKTTSRRRRHTMSEPGRRKHTRRRRSRRGLSEMFSATTAQAAAKSILMGAAGGAIAGGVHRIVSKQNAGVRLGTGVVASFLTYAVAGFPNMAAGMAGAFTALESNFIYDKLLSEDGSQYFDYADASALNEMPVYLNEAGEAVYLNEGIELAEEMYLAEGIYPDYSTQY